MQGSARSEAGFMQLGQQEGHHMQTHRAPSSRMVRTMSVPHMPMGPGQQQPMYSDYNGQVITCSQASPLQEVFCRVRLQSLHLRSLGPDDQAKCQYCAEVGVLRRVCRAASGLSTCLLKGSLPAQGGYFLPASSGFSTIPEVPGQPFHMSGGVTSRGMRHSASAMELPRSGAVTGPLHEGFPMFGPGAAMGPLSNMPHFGSPRAQRVSCPLSTTLQTTLCLDVLSRQECSAPCWSMRHDLPKRCGVLMKAGPTAGHE